MSTRGGEGGPAAYDQDGLDSISRQINTTPRRSLQWKTAYAC
ncbi:MAG: hypothetical protein M0Z46_02145 [Actinomycetota bacterium]|nr:hypothetical protein [Actinomycetota bacterium]